MTVTPTESPRVGSGLRRAGTAVFGAQLVLLVSAGWLAILYARGLAATGSRAALGAISPEALVPFGVEAVNPFAWLHAVATLTAVLGDGVGALLAVAGLALGVLTDLRHDRRRARALLVTSLLCVAVVVVLSTSVGDDLHYWFIPD